MTPRQLRVQRKKWRVNSKRHYERKKKKKAIQQLLLDNSPPNNDNEVLPTDPLTQSAPRPMHNSYLNRLDYGNSNSCQGCLKKDILLRKNEGKVENVNTHKREKIKKKLMFGEILSRSVGEGYKCLRQKNKTKFSNVVMTEKEKLKS
ncbi:unnamed protein product [Parnassius apollo]|uniref:(apollo) hypothetical protein n=1 Tax=Parnassius apollo TaxID=110799 RepID=A0A8S3W4E4_PARAO|nr:unnamed protein product [Parnassius apollo]